MLTRPRLDDAGRALLFTEARTANSFTDTAVTDEELREIWELARFAPLAFRAMPDTQATGILARESAQADPTYLALPGLPQARGVAGEAEARVLVGNEARRSEQPRQILERQGGAGPRRW